MKKNEGKIRNIHSRQDREKLKEAEFDSKLYSTMRSNFAKEGKKIAGELENDEKLDYVGDAPDLLNKIVGQLREEGKWDDNAYRQECKKELYDLLPQEDQIALRRGRKLAKIEEKWKKNRKKIMQRAAIIVLVGGVFAAGLGADASKEHIMNVWGRVTNTGQRLVIDKTDDTALKGREDEDSAETTELFEWRFENSESEVAPLGTYYAKGHAGISKVSSKSVYITATTDCYEKCNTVEAEVNLQRLENNTWYYVTSRDKVKNNVGSVKVSDTVSVKSGYYYRVISFHSATKNGKTETGSAVSESIYIG